MATSPRSPTDTSALDQFEIGEGISPGGNPELLDALIDLGDESSPRGPGLAPPHTVTSDAMELSAPVLDPGARQHSLQDLDLDLTPKSPSKVQIVLDLEMAEGECKKFPQEPSLADALLVLNSVHAGNALSLEIKPSASPIADGPARRGPPSVRGAVTAGAAVAEPHSGELDYNGPELAHSAELDYQGADDLPELLPREAAQAPAPRGFARPGDLG